jgi:HEAT repeat protein
MLIAVHRKSVLLLAGAAFTSITLLGGCASSNNGNNTQQDPQRQQQRPPAANELPPPSNPGTVGSLGSINGEGVDVRDWTTFREAAIAELEILLTHPQPEIRANATEGLLGAPSRLKPRLGSLLTDRSAGVRAVAAVAVGDGRIDEWIPTVRAMTADPSPYVRASAIYALAVNDVQVNQTPLATMLLTDSNTRVRAHAASLLGKMGNASALPLLREAASVPTPRAGQNQWRLLDLQIAEAMVRLNDESRLDAIRSALYQTRAEDIEVAMVAAQILAELNDRASISAMINLAAQRDPAGNSMPLEVQLGVASALSRMGSLPNEGLLIESAQSSEAQIRAFAAHALAGSASPEGLAALGSLLSDPAVSVRVAAASAVLRMDNRFGAGNSGFSAGAR